MADFQPDRTRQQLIQPQSLTHLPTDILENIVRRLQLPDSASLSRLHPTLRLVYRRVIELQVAQARTLEDFVTLVDRVLAADVGVLRRLSIRLQATYNNQGTADEINAAVTRWLVHVRRLQVSELELQGVVREGRPVTIVNLLPNHWPALTLLRLSSVEFPFLDAAPIAGSLPNLDTLYIQHIFVPDLLHSNSLGFFLQACPNLRRLTLRRCSGNGLYHVNSALLQLLDISDLRFWTINFSSVPSLTHLHIRSHDLSRIRISSFPIYEDPVPQTIRLRFSAVRSLSITVETNLRAVTAFIQCFPLLRHLNVTWNAPATIDEPISYVYGLDSLDSVTLGGMSPWFDERPFQVFVEFILVRSPRLSRLSLVVPRFPPSRELGDDYLLEIGQVIRGRPRASQQAQLEFSWTDN